MAYAGRRAHSLSAGLDVLAARIRDLLDTLEPTVLVGAAADGTDLLVLEAALAMPVPPDIHLVLPTARDVFAQDSVDADWRSRFDAVMDEVGERGGGSIRELDREPGESAYREANQAILDTAESIGAEQQLVVMVVADEGEGRMIEDLLDRARSRPVRVMRIAPSVVEAGRPSADEPRPLRGADPGTTSP